MRNIPKTDVPCTEQSLAALHRDSVLPRMTLDSLLGDSNNTASGYCLDIARFEESLNN